jgi:hypothetical protein
LVGAPNRLYKNCLIEILLGRKVKTSGELGFYIDNTFLTITQNIIERIKIIIQPISLKGFQGLVNQLFLLSSSIYLTSYRMKNLSMENASTKKEAGKTSLNLIIFFFIAWACRP